MNTRCLLSALALGLLSVPRSFAGDPADLHTAWDRLLSTHVQEGWVDYRGFQQEADALDAYLKTLAETDPGALARADQLAYWINAYNAFTVRLILNHHPVASIRDIDRPWKQKTWVADGKTYSLDEIEHAILRKEFKEPRIHFAIVCASIGCPNLRSAAYTGAGLEAQLEAAAQAFLASPKHLRIETERERPVLRVSSLFDWFGEDFTQGGAATLADFIAAHAPSGIAEAIRGAGPRLSVTYLTYDWKLNERPAAPGTAEEKQP